MDLVRPLRERARAGDPASPDELGTAPAGGEDNRHLEKPELKRIIEDPSLQGLQVLAKLFFTSSEASQAAGQAFVARLAARTGDWEPVSGPKVAQAQLAAFRSSRADAAAGHP